MTDVPHMCFDRILPRDLNRPQRPPPTVAMGGPMRAIIVISKMWTNGSTIGVRFMGGTDAQQQQAEREALMWTEHANLTFDFNNRPNADIRISFDPAEGAWSFVGTDCTHVDLSLFQVIEGLTYAFPQALRAAEHDHPKVVALHDRVAERPNIAAYLNSDRRIPFNQHGVFRHYPELDALI